MKKYNKNKTVVIEISGGVGEFTNVPENVTPLKIDYDTLENGECPICGYSFDHSKDIFKREMEEEYMIVIFDNYCAECGIDWKKFKLEDILEDK